MKSKYYNIWEFDQIVALIDTNPAEAKIRLQKYIEKYPKDYSAYSYYVYILIILGNITAAEKFLDYSERISSTDFHFCNDDNRLSYFKYGNLLNKLRILSYKDLYSEAYNLYQKNLYLLNDDRFWGFEYYLRSKLGMLDHTNRDDKSYVFRQMTDYQEDDFLEHIKRHLSSYDLGMDDGVTSFFSIDFPFSTVFEEIKRCIPSDKRLFKGFFQDYYVFKYDNCGRDNNKLTDYFSVVCFHNTSNFITMCPAVGCENLPHVDLNYLANQQTSKVKTMSQIEKFNRRYRRG